MAIMSEHSRENSKMSKELKDALLQTLSLGIVAGFFIGLIAASFLHKYIVHPLGF